MNLIPDNIDFDSYFAEQECDPAKVKPASHWLAAVIDRFHGDKTSSSWQTTGFGKMDGFFELREGEVTLWAGVNGHGKTTFLSHVMLNVMRTGGKVCIASLEMPPAASMAKMSRQAAGLDNPAEKFLRDFHAWTDERLWIYDHVGKVKAQRMLAVATYVRKELGIQHLVIDSLMKCGLGTDDYTAQKDFVDSLCAIARDTGLHIHLVVHMRKGETEHKPSDKFDVKGAGEITDLVDNLMIVWKDQRKSEIIDDLSAQISRHRHVAGLNPDQREKKLAQLETDLAEARKKPDALVRVAKQRHFEHEGRFVFWFDKGAQQFLEKPFDRASYIDPGELAEEHYARARVTGAAA